VGIAQRASMAALKFGVVVQRLTFCQCFFLPAFGMYSITAAQPTQIIGSFEGIIVEVQWFGTTATVEAVVCIPFHGVSRDCFAVLLNRFKK